MGPVLGAARPAFSMGETVCNLCPGFKEGTPIHVQPRREWTVDHWELGVRQWTVSRGGIVPTSSARGFLVDSRIWHQFDASVNRTNLASEWLDSVI